MHYGDIYCDIVFIGGFEAYCCIGVIMWGIFVTKYHWCHIGGTKLF